MSVADHLRLRAYIREAGLSQAELATRSKVSQATVSRALRGDVDRHSEARHKLFIYAGLETEEDQTSTVRGIKLITSAFSKIWDGSDAHAIAVAKIIESLGGLRPNRE